MKLLDIESAPVITPAMERAVVKAFEEFDTDRSRNAALPPPKTELEHRTEKGTSCDHLRQPVPSNPENVQFLQELFGEKDLGKEQTYCVECGAVFLYGGYPDRFGKDDSTGIWTAWGYDLTARFFGKPPRMEPRRDDRKERRPKR